MPISRGPVSPFCRRYSTLETLPSLRGDVRELAPTVKAALFQNETFHFPLKLFTFSANADSEAGILRASN